MTTEDSQPTSDQRVLSALREARRKLEAAEQRQHQPVAVIGIGCRFPGGADSPERFWQNLQQGVDAAGEVPAERWDIDAFYDPDPDAPGKMYTREASFLDQIDLFDPQFFRISPREAASLDPQQRLLLEVAWEALEHAGQAPESLRGSDTGCYIGFSWHDYEREVFRLDPLRVDAYGGLGNSQSIAAGRLSFFLGSHGPTSLVDTACSSSLVAVHLACQALRSGESSLMLAGGVNLMISPLSTIFCAKIKALSPDGRCKTFAADADGYGRGEGCGIVALKRLDDALAAGDNVLAVIRGSAINHDGPSSGLTVPNRWAQRRVIEAALRNGRVDPLDVTYIEAHGTGTALGDPIEINALGDALGAERAATAPLWVGSVKTNIGHLEAAAGIAGLIKDVLAVQHGEIPRSLHFSEPNPLIDWDAYPVAVPDESLAWPADRPRIAGVSSFGFSGTNCHVVVEEAPPPSPRDSAPGIGGDLFCFSARSPEALAALAERHLAHFTAHPDTDHGDACFTAAVGRNHFEHRMAISAADIDELRESLATVVAGGDAPGVVSARAGAAPGKVAFLFTGQGAQWAGMGRDLYDRHADFRATLDHCAALLAPELDRPLLEVMFDADSDLLDQTAYTQPALFALEYALAALWRAWGIEADIVLGHSVGEYVAACVAGVFSLEDGLRLIAARGRLMQALPAGGAMAAVSASEDEVAAVLDPWRDRLSIAAINAPDSVVLSGDEAALAEALAVLAESGHTVQRLAVSHAFHSPLMDPMLAAFREVAESIDFRPPQRELISNVSGRLADASVGTAAYWVEHVRAPVRFADAMATLDGLGCGVHLEVGPQATLSALGRRCLPASKVAWLSSLRRGRPAWRELLGALGGYYVHGGQPDWAGVTAGRDGRRVPLATYPFQRQRYWVEPPSPTAALPGGRDSGHPLLGTRIDTVAQRQGEILFESIITPQHPPFLVEHRVFDRIIVPATAFIEIALAAACEIYRGSQVLLQDLEVRKPLILKADSAARVQTLLTPAEDDAYRLETFSTPADAPPEAMEWQSHAAVRISAHALDLAAIGSISSEPVAAGESLDIAAGYALLRGQGIDLGETFHSIESLQRANGEVSGVAARAVHDTPGHWVVHPAMLDGCGQGVAMAYPPGSPEETFLPIGFERLILAAPAADRLQFRARLRPTRDDDTTRAYDMALFDEGGQPIARIEGATTMRASREAVQRSLADAEANEVYELTWIEQKATQSASTGDEPGSWLVLHDDTALGRALIAQIERSGRRCVTASPGAGFAEIGGDRFTIARDQREHYDLVVDACLQGEAARLDGAVLLCSTDPVQNDQTSSDTIEQQLLAATCSGLFLTQALLQATGTPPDLWLLTSGAQAVLDKEKDLRIAQTALWGLSRVIDLEHPELRCHDLDLDPYADDASSAAARICDELFSTTNENQIAFRGERRYVARLLADKVVAKQQQARKRIRSDRSYLVTGALGALGLLVVDWLVANGARHLTLLGRRPPAAQAQSQLDRYAADGVEIRTVACDVSRYRELEEVFVRFGSDLPALAGVVHTAGVLDDSSILQLDGRRLANVIAAKALGAWNLHRLSCGSTLDFSVYYSSATTLLGSRGQGNYSAANAFLDGLARYRNARGLPGLSISWGPWGEAGMAATMNDIGKRRMHDIGWSPLSNAAGVDSLARLIDSDRVQVGVLPLTWSRFLAQFGERPVPAYFSAVMPAHPVVTGEAAGTRPQAEIRDALLSASGDARIGIVQDFLQGAIAQVAGLDTSQLPAVDAAISELGLDSLMLMELRNKINTAFRIRMPIGDLIASETVSEMSISLLAHLAASSVLPDDDEDDAEFEEFTL